MTARKTRPRGTQSASEDSEATLPAEFDDLSTLDLDDDEDEGAHPTARSELDAGFDVEALREEFARLASQGEDEEEEEEDTGGSLDESDVSPDVREAALRLGIERLHPEQKQAIGALLDGHDVLMVLPTGFGKSAVYQIPSMILAKPVLVISPLLALMKDQTEKLEKRDIPVVRLDGTVRGRKRKEALARVERGGSLLVMTTPESLFAPDVIGALQKSGVSVAAIDEAHCISEWGYDFRPAYLQLGERVRSLGRPAVLALTATATPKVRDAVQRFLGMDEPVVISSSPHRSNLAFDVLHCSEGARLRALLRLAFRVRRPGIIYCSTTREVDEIYAVLQRFGIPSHRYHGKMSSSERNKQQEGFMRRGRRTVMVATNAFGLGIDKADIRYVMHYHAPGSLEQYVQEAGRAGRDGRRANCILLYSPQDRQIHEALLSRSRVRPEQLYRLGHALAAWAAEGKTPSLDALALSANLGTRTTGALLALLAEATLVKFDQEAVHVTVPADEIEPESRQLATQFETLRTQDARRLDTVSEYANEQGCRAAFLAGYFGEDDDYECGLCDRCRGSSERPESFFEPLTPPRRATRRRGASRRRGSSGRREGAREKGGRGGRRRGRSRRGGRPAEAREVQAAHPGGSEPGPGGNAPRRRRRRRGRKRGRGRSGTPAPSPETGPASDG